MYSKVTSLLDGWRLWQLNKAKFSWGGGQGTGDRTCWVKGNAIDRPSVMW